jgi:WXG100 family type VII secretion target
MSNLNVTYEEMHSAASQLKAGRAEIEGQLSKLKSMVDGLVAGGYVTDKSSKAFQTSYEEFNTGVNKTIEGLDGMGEYLSQAAKALQDTDEQLASALSKGPGPGGSLLAQRPTGPLVPPDSPGG